MQRILFLDGAIGVFKPQTLKNQFSLKLIQNKAHLGRRRGLSKLPRPDK